MNIIFFAFVLVFFFFAAPAQAFDKYFSTHCKTAGVPKALAVAVARQESSLNPLCINVAGTDVTPKNREEAIVIIQKAEKAKKSYDVGLMQINSQWTRAWKIDPVSLLDPDTNIRLGVKILRKEIDRHGLNWQAVGKYHSPNPLRGRNYAWMVSRRISGDSKLKEKVSAPGGPVYYAGSGRIFREGNGHRSKHIRKLPSFSPLSSICAGDLGQASVSQRRPVGLN